MVGSWDLMKLGFSSQSCAQICLHLYNEPGPNLSQAHSLTVVPELQYWVIGARRSFVPKLNAQAWAQGCSIFASPYVLMLIIYMARNKGYLLRLVYKLDWSSRLLEARLVLAPSLVC